MARTNWRDLVTIDYLITTELNETEEVIGHKEVRNVSRKAERKYVDTSLFKKVNATCSEALQRIRFLFLIPFSFSNFVNDGHSIINASSRNKELNTEPGSSRVPANGPTVESRPVATNTQCAVDQLSSNEGASSSETSFEQFCRRWPTRSHRLRTCVRKIRIEELDTSDETDESNSDSDLAPGNPPLISYNIEKHCFVFQPEDIKTSTPLHAADIEVSRCQVFPFFGVIVLTKPPTVLFTFTEFNFRLKAQKNCFVNLQTQFITKEIVRSFFKKR